MLNKPYQRLGVLGILALSTLSTYPFISHAQSKAALTNTQTPASATTMLSFSIPVEVRKTPDIATVSATVLTEAASAQEAMQQNASQMARVFEALRKAQIAERDVQTQGLLLQPLYLYQENKPPRIRGYQASNTLSLRIRKIEALGPVLDQLVTQGVTQITGPNFEVDEPDAALDQARAQALKAAQARASMLASAVGMRLKRIVSINEGGQVSESRPVPLSLKATASAQSLEEPTPTAGGEISLTTRFNIVFELEPKN
jgi:uncharacterized protein